MQRILISGINGRLGNTIKNAIEQSYLLFGHVKNECLKSTIDSSKPDIIIDVTSAKNIQSHLAVYLQYQVPTIIGTSGLTPKEAYDMTSRCPFPLLIMPNFSESFQYFFQQVKTMHKQYPAFKIIETHCSTKVDAPSGCSLFLSHVLNNTPITSHRVSNYIAKHEVYFGDAVDSIILTHEIHQPCGFIPGVIKAINHINTLKTGQVFIS